MSFLQLRRWKVSVTASAVSKRIPKVTSHVEVARTKGTKTIQNQRIVFVSLLQWAI
ncbi:MAG TPA: hypothetical protein PKA06_07610 [Gemmatales bacterium]|nr:hypothetical protein [Gemmatales bacterium]